MQGPICSYDEIQQQLFEGHSFDSKQIISGLRRVLLGFFKKIVIADLIGIAVNSVFSNYQKYHGVFLLLIAIFYAIQLYADFSGYMDIALGFSQMLGIGLPENFDLPYFSHSISEFWRKWHISLGKWFRNYLYYPILRSTAISKIKKIFGKKGRKFGETFVTVIALIIVWTSIGLWHGASFHFLIYGCFHGFFVIMDAIFGNIYTKLRNLLHIKSNSKVFGAFQIVRTFYIVCIGYFIFRSDGMGQAIYMIKESFKIWDLKQITHDNVFSSLGLDWWAYVIVAFSILICYFGSSFFRESNSKYLLNINLQKKIPAIVQYLILVLLIVSICFAFIYEQSIGDYSSSFIYFEF